ncbi:hypothetical protein [Tepidiforma sp.]|uniref:hypothetical protein n=1 Tax=Tepidiforma sp. TaxID=2682230 RepID=UPI002ADE054B|nr:hypothetical protein [Tepidiforma sp.]
MNWLAALFATPARQALGWTALGILGVIFAALGTWLLIRGGQASPPAAPAATATPAAAATPSPTPTPRPSPTATATATAATPAPTATPTPRPQPTTSGTGGSGATAPPTPTPTPPPTAARPYCPPASVGPGTLPTARIAGAITRGGQPVPAGTVDVIATFDGVPGPARRNTVDGGYAIDFYSAGEDCANRVGATIGVLVEGRSFPSPYTIGSQPPLIVIDVELP